MGLVVLVLRSALTLVFVAAAGGKLLDLAGSRRALEEFGLPRPAALVGGTLLPAIELAVAAALLPTPSARWGGLGALALLLCFVAAIARLMRAGRAPDCHCFGQLHSEPAGRRTLIRNGVLAAAALVVLAAGPGRSLASLDAEDAALLSVSVVLLGMIAASWSLALENRDLRRRPVGRGRPPAEPGLPIAAAAPDLALRTLAGDHVALHDLIGRGGFAVLVHVSPGCGPCRALAPSLAGWRVSLSGTLAVVTVSSGGLAENATFARELGLDDLLVARPSDFADAYRARATPTAVMIDPAGRIAHRSVAGALAIESLIRVALRRANATVTLDPAPILQVTRTA